MNVRFCFEFVSKKKPTDYIDVYIYDDHAVIEGREHNTTFMHRVTTLEGWEAIEKYNNRGDVYKKTGGSF